MLTASNKIVNGLWIGNELSNIELLTLHSFLQHGHNFQLWVYDEIKTALPAGVVLQDANNIIPASQIFRYKHSNKYGHGKGSVAGFSDLFRYKLMYEKGGWWVDMDVTCLRPLEITEPYFFRSHHDLQVVGNVLKCEPKSELMIRCFQEAQQTIDENNTDWLKPIAILNKHITDLSLEGYIKPAVSNQDQWPEVRELIYRNKPLPGNYYFIHWMNEEWRSRDMDKEKIRYRSTLGKLLYQYGLLQKPKSSHEMFYNDFVNLLQFYFA